MSDETNKKDAGDGAADAIAATALVALAVLTMYIWLSGMPS